MTIVRLFTLFELQKFPKYFRNKTGAKVITTALFLVVFAFLAVGIYFFFRSGLRYISLDVIEDLQKPLLLFLYELFFLVLAIVIILFSFVAGVFNLFRNDAMGWIISSPSYKYFPRFIYIKSLLSASLPMAILFIPGIVAFVQVFTLPWYGLILILLGVFALLSTLTSLTLLGILLGAHIYKLITSFVKIIPFTVQGLVMFVIAISSIASVYAWKIIGYVDIVKLFRAEETDFVVDISTIGDHFSFFSTHPLAMFLVHFQFGNYATAHLYLGLLFAISIGLLVLWWMISPTYYPLWKKFQDGKPTQERGSKLSSTHLYNLKFTGSQSMVILKKEFVIFSRNLRGLLWLFFLLLIWITQIVVSASLNKNVILYQTDLSPKMIQLQVLQCMVALYFICSFTLRFVFTSFSVEKRTRWILGSAPLGFKKLFLGKYYFYNAAFLALGVIMTIISLRVLSITPTHGLWFLILFTTSVIGVVTMGMTLGALFPSFDTDDPEIISTSMSGLLFTGISLLYAALSSYTLYLMLSKGLIFLLIIHLCATVCIVLMLLHRVFTKRLIYHAE